LVGSITPELLKPVAWWLQEIMHVFRRRHRVKLAPCHFDEIGWESLRTQAVEKDRTTPVPKASDHHLPTPTADATDSITV
jgi:hypothetical protein